MKLFFNLLGFLFLIFTQIFFLNEKVYSDDGWKNYYGMAWDDTPANHIKYAKQMGYDYIAIKNGASVNEYKRNPDVAGLKFYLVDPHTYMYTYSNYSRFVDTTKSYAQSEKDFYNKNMVWKSNDPFPKNLASGYILGTPTKYNVEWDWQQQTVINTVVERILALAHSYEDATLPFTFAGVLIDVPRLQGEFNYWDSVSKTEKATELSYWTGSDSGLLHSTITHEYATYRKGKAAYFKRLASRMKQEFSNAKWILQPWRLYHTISIDEWVYQIKDRDDKDALTPDMLSQENIGAAFVDDPSNFNSGVNITKDRVENTQHTDTTEYQNRLIAAKAGINGAWYNWFGSFMAGGYFPNFQSITEVYPRLKLIRVIPNWDNLNNIPLANRSWDGSIYQSTKNGNLQSYISSDVMYSRHWKNGKIFAVFNTTNGVIKLNTGESVTSVKRTDGYFIETVDGRSDVTISGTEIRLKSSVAIAIDSDNGQVKGNGYIITLAGTSSSTVPDGSFSINDGAAYTKATGITLNLSATDDIGVTGYYLSTSSAIPSATSAGWTSIAATASYSANVPYTLSSGNGSKTIYVWYKDAAGNVSATVSESIILDMTAPAITITSPTSNATYSTTSGTISLGGNASDVASGVNRITWSNNDGGSGTASGTTSWSIARIALSSGSNIITVTVTDKAGNNDTDTITVIYSNSNNIQAYYALDTGTGSTATDSSGNNRNGTIIGAVWSTGKTGKGLRFNGNADYVSIPRMNYDEISISAWFYKNVRDTSNADAIFGGWRWEDNTQLLEGYDLRFYQDSPDTLQFVLVTQNGGGVKTQKKAEYNFGNSVGAWYHVAGTYNKTTGEQKLYIDGQLVDTQTHPAGNTVVPLSFYSDMRIGHSRVNDGYFNGIIDEVRIYNQALSDQMVLELSANTLAGHWKFDEGSGTVANDSSGNNRNGTIIGAVWSTGKTGKGLRFNGTADYVSIPRMYYDEISISAWFYKNVRDTSNADAIFGGWRWEDNTQLQEGYDLRFYQDSPDRLEFVLVTQDGGGVKTQKKAEYNFGNSVGAWYHVAGTYNKTTGEQKLYIDGQLVDTQTHPAGNVIVPLTSYSDMRIGYSRVNDGYFNGTLDDVRLYNNALSAQKVLELFNTSATNGQ